MTDEEFWSLIDRLGGAANSRTTRRLVRALERAGVDVIEEFGDRLSEKVSELSTAPLAGVPVLDLHDPPGSPLVPVPGDALIHLHLAVIPAGRSVFDGVLRDPARIAARPWDFSESDELADAAATAYTKVTDLPWPGPVPGFSDADERSADADGDVSWITFTLYGEPTVPAAYVDAAGAIVESLGDDPAWTAWWAGFSSGVLHIDIEYTPGDERGGVSSRKGHGRASFRRDSRKFRGLTPGNLAHLAYADLDHVGAQVAAALGLPGPPPTPRPAGAVAPTERAVASRERLAELRRRHREGR
ncbi:DUF4240 domain-containing protein [Streptomyces sp. CA-146814]|uniref:DUF4240 domain-containing protein n=1 Tax=Streptomyces sp. CA-146814 TaxID=3240053 RepID=UPI003D8FD00B